MRKFQKNILNERNRLQNEVALLNDQRALITRSINQLNGISHEGKRDIYEIYGYPQELSGNDGFKCMYKLSRRMGFANRLTNGMPKSCWREGFNLIESAEEGADKIEEETITKLNKQGMTSAFEKVDILNRIGRFSVLFVGVPDGRESSQPVGSVSGDKIKDIFFKPFAYDGIIVSDFEKDTKSPRFGKPNMYQVQRMGRGDTDKDQTLLSLNIHWSRIIHLNENGLDSDIEGMGYLEPVYNRLLDFQKAVGGSAEAYFRNARRVLAAEIDPAFASALQNNPEAKEAFNESTKEFVNEQKDFLTLGGAKVQQLQSTHASPLDTAKSILLELMGYTGYPARILTGEGGGQLAGSEDKLTYNGLVADRQELTCSDWVVRLFEIFQAANIVKLPDSYIVEFPLQEEVSETQKLENDNKKADTLLKVSQAVSQPGSEIDSKTALIEVGLNDIKMENIDDLDEEGDEAAVDDFNKGE